MSRATPLRCRWLEAPRRRPVLITGGAGFIGTNLAHRLLSTGVPVLLLDNFSRLGVAAHLAWLREQHRSGLTLITGDVRDTSTVREAVFAASRVFHFAAQVAVTDSLAAPRHDFEVNACGTLNVLEAARAAPGHRPVLLTSTNKVYGSLRGIDVAARAGRYEAADPDLRGHGISERQPLEFRSPYGCSKGAADQYVLDYAQTFGVPTTVFRMSCIYGPHQCGTEDQGWVAHFLLSALRGAAATIYGDGRQVRDILFVDDLVDALLLAHEHMPDCAGQAFNIGGGPLNAISLLDLLAQIRELSEHALPVEYRDWRPGDQRYYVSDCTKFETCTGWRPRVPARQGVARLWAWLRTAQQNRSAADRTSSRSALAAPAPRA
ncbi:MAG: GDP-mannose 4,6-dehydratase [Candidatus Binatia bacterium]